MRADAQDELSRSRLYAPKKGAPDLAVEHGGAVARERVLGQVRHLAAAVAEVDCAALHHGAGCRLLGQRM